MGHALDRCEQLLESIDRRSAAVGTDMTDAETRRDAILHIITASQRKCRAEVCATVESSVLALCAAKTGLTPLRFGDDEPREPEE